MIDDSECILVLQKPDREIEEKNYTNFKYFVPAFIVFVSLNREIARMPTLFRTNPKTVCLQPSIMFMIS